MGDMDCHNLLKITLARKYCDSPISEFSQGHGETGKIARNFTKYKKKKYFKPTQFTLIIIIII